MCGEPPISGIDDNQNLFSRAIASGMQRLALTLVSLLAGFCTLTHAIICLEHGSARQAATREWMGSLMDGNTHGTRRISRRALLGWGWPLGLPVGLVSFSGMPFQLHTLKLPRSTPITCTQAGHGYLPGHPMAPSIAPLLLIKLQAKIVY